MGVQADRLYVGDTLVWDASAAPPPGDEGWTDTFDRPALSHGTHRYTLANLIPGGSAAHAAMTDSGVSITGYVGAALREAGTDGTITARSVWGTPQLVVRYADPDNWVGWFPAGNRLRFRIGGVSHDITTPSSSPGQVLALTVTPENIAAYVGDKIVVAVADTRLASATMAGISTASASTGADYSTAVWTPRVAFDPEPTLAALASAATAAAARDALAPVVDEFGATITIGAGAPFSAPTPDGDPEAWAALAAVVRALSALPPEMAGRRGAGRTWAIIVGTGLLAAGSPASGLYNEALDVVYINATPTESHLSSVTTDMQVARESVVVHELGHMVMDQCPLQDASTALIAAFNAANPPGFTYGGTVTGGRPTGFCRGYGTKNMGEDFADVFAWMFTAGLRAELIARTATDVHLKAKVAATRTFLMALGWEPSRFAPFGV